MVSTMEDGPTDFLVDVFRNYCTFGTGKNATPVMDGAQFSKFFRDMKLLDKKLTSARVDIIFSLSKGKGGRRINYEQFLDAIHKAAKEKYPEDKMATNKIKDLILVGGGTPSTAGSTQIVDVSNVERLTNTSLYTGTHKERFDKKGKGKGLAGRDSTPKGQGHIPSFARSGIFSTSSHSIPSPRKKKTKVVPQKDSMQTSYETSRQARIPRSGSNYMASLPSYVTGYKGQGTYGKKR